MLKRVYSGTNKDSIWYITYSATTVTIKNYLNNSFTITTYNVGESETTPAGNSLGFTGTWGTASWNLVAVVNSMGAMSPGIQFPTPIVLSKFNYTVVNKQVNLHWETVSEINNKYFAVEKSTDGINFYEIGRVNGAGTSNSVKQYAFTDNKPAYINHYRLRQVEFDGKATTSKIVYVKVQQAASIQLVQNIVSSQLEVLVQNEAKDYINIYDFSGKRIKQVQALTGKQFIDVSTLSVGSYLLSWHSNTGEAVNLVFQKVN